MGWNKDGSTIKASYLDEHIVQGVVVESRVSYGGSVRYLIELSDPVFIGGSFRECLVIKEDNVIADFGVIEETEEDYVE